MNLDSLLQPVQHITGPQRSIRLPTQVRQVRHTVARDGDGCDAKASHKASHTFPQNSSMIHPESVEVKAA